jgi:ABC-type lipoprotein export system ATPase subunit
MPKILELCNVSKIYSNVDVLKNVNFAISSGEAIAIIGPSGSGKTTLLNIASLLDTPSIGEISYFEQKINERDYTNHRKAFIGFVYQQHNLMPEFTILENIEIIAKFKNSYNAELISHLLNQVEIYEHRNKKPAELSGGQKQRASIVRAIASKPHILFTDEPTGNLDPKSAEIASNLLVNLTKEQNIALFLITHNLQIAQKCNTIYEIADNSLVKYAK